MAKSNMRVSQSTVDMIKEFEGNRLDAYLDTLASPNVWTIGYGDTGPDVRPGLRITQQEAENRLLRRLNEEFLPGVLRVLDGAPVTQNQLDAMTSFSYNVGLGGFGRSSVARLHKAGDYRGAADAFLLWNKAGGKVYRGLVRRREAERALYLSDVPQVVIDISVIDRAIRGLQQLLIDAGLYDGRVDGDPGPLTQKALEAYRSK